MGFGPRMTNGGAQADANVYVKGTTEGMSVKALFPLMVTPTRTADDPTSTVIVPVDGKVRT